MADYGLLGGLAEGLKQGLGAYQQGRQFQDEQRRKLEEKALQEKLAKLGMFDKGIMETADGGFGYTPEKQQERDLDTQKKQAEIAKTLSEAKKSGANSGIESYIKALEIRSKQDQLEKNKREASEAQEKVNSPSYKFGLLPKETQVQVEDLGKGMASRTKISSTLNAGLSKLDDPKISEDQKLITARQMIKALNSTEGQDAVGAEEANRLAGLLEFRFFNLTDPGPFMGRAPIGEFATQVRNKLGELGQAKSSMQSEIDALYRRSGRPELASSDMMKEAPKTQAIDPDAERYAQMHNLTYEVAKGILDGRKSKSANFTSAR